MEKTSPTDSFPHLKRRRTICRNWFQSSSQFTLDRRKRVVKGFHEQGAHQIDHKHARAIGCLDQIGTLARRRSGRIIGRPQQARFAVDIGQGFALVPGMITERERIDTEIEQAFTDLLGVVSLAKCIDRLLQSLAKRNRGGHSRYSGKTLASHNSPHEPGDTYTSDKVVQEPHQLKPS